MTNNLPVLFVEQFTTNVQFLSQQKGSRLRKTVMNGTHVGSQAAAVDQFAAVNALKVTTRYAPMGRVDGGLDRRWVFPVDYELPQLVDSFDKLRLIIDPTSYLSQSAIFAMGRAQDDEIIAAYGGIAKTGNNGGTNTAFLAGNVVSVQQGAAAPTGMTVAKLRAAKLILMQNEVDLDNDELWLSCQSKQIDDLLAEAQVVSTDFNDKPVLVDGRIQRFLGINFVHTERLGTAIDDQAGTSTPCYVYAKSGMYFGEWEAIQTHISQRNDLTGLPWQVYCKGTFGATRLEEKKIVKIFAR